MAYKDLKAEYRKGLTEKFTKLPNWLASYWSFDYIGIVYSILAMQVTSDTGSYGVSLNMLARGGIAKRRAMRAVANLVAAGVLTKEGTSTNRTQLYRVACSSTWPKDLPALTNDGSARNRGQKGRKTVTVPCGTDDGSLRNRHRVKDGSLRNHNQEASVQEEQEASSCSSRYDWAKAQREILAITKPKPPRTPPPVPSIPPEQRKKNDELIARVMAEHRAKQSSPPPLDGGEDRGSEDDERKFHAS